MSKYPFLFVESRHCDCKKKLGNKKRKVIIAFNFDMSKNKKTRWKNGFFLDIIKTIYWFPRIIGNPSDPDPIITVLVFGDSESFNVASIPLSFKILAVKELFNIRGYGYYFVPVDNF